MSHLTKGVLNGDVRAVARALTVVEGGMDGRRDLVRELFPHTGGAHIIGMTGPPGVGKSTIVDSMITKYREEERRIGVIAVDPTSPFTGGAILGDRIRMVAHSTDPGVFVRSMGSRGSLGGLAPSTVDAVTVLDAAGYDTIIVETVGAGQAEVDIVRASHTTLVVEVPGLGDDVQVMKAGLMEIGDIFVVNKADLPDAGRLVVQIESLISLMDRSGWVPPVVKTVGHDPGSLADLLTAIERHRGSHDRAGAGVRARAIADHWVRILIEEQALERVIGEMGGPGYSEMVDRIISKEIDPYTAVDEMFARYFP
jgi:LAO/AO transport system kinase